MSNPNSSSRESSTMPTNTTVITTRDAHPSIELSENGPTNPPRSNRDLPRINTNVQATANTPVPIVPQGQSALHPNRGRGRRPYRDDRTNRHIEYRQLIAQVAQVPTHVPYGGNYVQPQPNWSMGRPRHMAYSQSQINHHPHKTLWAPSECNGYPMSYGQTPQNYACPPQGRAEGLGFYAPASLSMPHQNQQQQYNFYGESMNLQFFYPPHLANQQSHLPSSITNIRQQTVRVTPQAPQPSAVRETPLQDFERRKKNPMKGCPYEDMEWDEKRGMLVRKELRGAKFPWEYQGPAS